MFPLPTKKFTQAHIRITDVQIFFCGYVFPSQDQQEMEENFEVINLSITYKRRC